MQITQSQPHAVEGFGLTTAQIIYRVPDHLQVLQEFVWQEFDLFPQFPSLNRFLTFWQEQLDGPLHSVTVAHQLLVKPSELSIRNGRYGLN